MTSILKPKSHGRLRPHSTDPAVSPLINPGYFNHPNDMPRMLEAVRVARRLAHSASGRPRGSRPVAPGAGRGYGRPTGAYHTLARLYIPPPNGNMSHGTRSQRRRRRRLARPSPWYRRFVGRGCVNHAYDTGSEHKRADDYGRRAMRRVAEEQCLDSITLA